MQGGPFKWFALVFHAGLDLLKAVNHDNIKKSVTRDNPLALILFL
jgi:hypothetical protein